MSEPLRLPAGSLVQRRLAALGAVRLAEDDVQADSVSQSYALGETIFGDVARDLVANGWAVYPQEIYGDRRLPGRIRREVIKWREDHRLDERLPRPEALEEWIRWCPAHNVALVLGRGSGDAFSVDIDVLDELLSYDIRRLAEDILGATPLRRVGNAPKVALFFRWASPEEAHKLQRTAFKFRDATGRGREQGLDILNYAKSVTIYGRHHRTGRNFSWEADTPLTTRPEDLPAVTAEDVQRFVDAVDVLHPFARGAGFQAGEVVLEFDETTQLTVPRRRRSADGAANWVEDSDGRITDGREEYLRHLAWTIVPMNAEAALSEGGVERLTAIVVEQFEQNAVVDGKWATRLAFEARGKVRYTIEKLRRGEIKPWTPERKRPGRVIGRSAVAPRAGARAPRDPLAFLPKPAASLDPSKAQGRTALPISVSEGVEGAAAARALRPDRSVTGAAVTQGIQSTLKSFFDAIYLPPEQRRSLLTLIQAPTGAGKTSQTLEFIAKDGTERPDPDVMNGFLGPRVAEDYEYIDEKGDKVVGRCPIVFMLPTYSNIEELRQRAHILGLDPSASAADLRREAADLGLIEEDAAEARLAELMGQARNLKLRCMVYKGKIQAGCMMRDKVELAAKAGIGTAGFCSSESGPAGERTTKYCDYHPAVNHQEPCPAIEQRYRIRQMDVVFLPHAFFALPLPEELKEVRAVIADERVHHLFLHTDRFELGILQKERPTPKLTKKEREEELDPETILEGRRRAVDVVMDALVARKAEDPVAALLRHPEADDWVKCAVRCCSTAFDVGRLITPELELDQVAEICSRPTGVGIKQEHRFWQIVSERLESARVDKVHRELTEARRGPWEARLKEIEAELVRAEPGSESERALLEEQDGLNKDLRMLVWRDRAKGSRDMRIQRIEERAPDGSARYYVRISWRTEPNWIDKPLLLLDASAQPEIISRIWTRSGDEDRKTDVAVVRDLNVRVVAIADSTYATSKLLPGRGAAPATVQDCARRLAKVRRAISLISAMYGHSRVVAGSTMKARRLINTGWKSPENVDWMHYGAVRGLDFAKHHDAAVSFGRLEPPVWVVDGVVAALTYDEDVPEEPFDRFGNGLDAQGNALRVPPDDMLVHMRSGHDVRIEVPRYPGKWAKMVQRQYREEEQSQFLGRLRPVYRGGEASTWFCFSSVMPEGLYVDDILHIDDIADERALPDLGSDWLLVELVRRCGVIDAALGARLAPDLFADEAAVRTLMERKGFNPAKGTDMRREAWGFVPILYGWNGTRRWAFVRGDVADPPAHLRELASTHLRRDIEILGVKAGPIDTEAFRAAHDGRWPTVFDAVHADVAEDGSLVLHEETHRRFRTRGRLPDKVDDALGTLYEREALEQHLMDRSAADVMRYVAQEWWFKRSSAGAAGGYRSFDEKPICIPFENKGQPVPMDAHKALQAIDHMHSAMADLGE